jgi:hypothetical protein
VDRESTRPVLVPIKGGLNPAYLLIPLVLGLVLGLGIGLKDRIAGSRVDRDGNYILLASTLYGQSPSQESAAELRQRLVRLGIAEPSYTVLTLADTYSTSRDSDLQRQADGLRIFGQALGGVTSAQVKIPTTTSTPAPTTYASGALPLATPSPMETPGSAAARLTPSATLTPALPATSVGTPTSSIVTLEALPTVTTTASPAVAATATPTARKATSTPTKTTGTTVNKSATVSTGTTQNVYVRKGPATNQAIIVTVPNGSKVMVLKSVTGEAIINGSSVWYLVNWTNGSGTIIQGYVYGKLVKFSS